MLRRALPCLALAAVLLGGGAPRSDAADAGDRAPPYSARALGAERAVSLAGLRGKAVMVNSWATWCVPCKKEMPALQRLADRYGARGLEVVGVSIDDRKPDPAVGRFAEGLGVRFTVWRDPDNDFQRTFKTTGVPQTILVDRHGTVVYHWRGALDDDETTEKLVASALASKGDYGDVAREAASTNSVGILLAFAAGLLSFLSPCVFPLVPSFVAFLLGAGGGAGAASFRGGSTVAVAARTDRSTVITGVLFVSGFTTIFLALGASASALGSTVRDSAGWLPRAGGVLLILFGLHLVGLLKVPRLEREYRKHFTARPAGHAGTFFIGAAFGAGWTPCIGPALAGILTLAATSGTFGEGMLLLAAYSLGLAIPFLAVTAALDRLRPILEGLRRIMPWVNAVSGALLVGVGLLLLTDSLQWLNDLFSGVLPEELG